MKDNSNLKLVAGKYALEKIEENDKELKESVNTTPDEYSYFINKKIIKPLDLQNFDTSFHLHKNIISYDINCKDIITSQSYYCISCKQSICTKCGINNHSDHILIQRDNCLFSDPNFFVEISKIIDISLKIGIKKQRIKDSIEKNVECIKQYLDEIKQEKFKEIDKYFENINKNVNNLKIQFEETKNKIENYYNRYNRFFNIKYLNEKINISDNTINNLDIENTVFLMNFDLMNLCDNKNLKVLDKLNEITNKINSIDKILSNKKNSLIQIIKSSFDFGLEFEPFENFYQEVKVRVLKFSEFINQFQETVADIFQRNGNLDKLKELLELFDSKNKKNKDIIFQQKFFSDEKNEMDNKVNISPESNLINDSKNNNCVSGSNEKKNKTGRNNLKVNLALNNKNNENKKKKSKSAKKTKIENIKKEQNNLNTTSKKNANNKFHLVKNYISEFHYNNNISNENRANKNLFTSKFTSEDVTLNNRILQRFFAYSIYEFYNKNFNEDLENKINNLKQTNTPNKLGSEHKNTNPNIPNYSKSKERNNSKIKSNTNSINTNKKEIIPNKEMINEQDKLDENQYNIKSLAYLSNYQNRFNSLKEIAKPIIGTNQIQIFDPSTKRIIKKTSSLNKDQHGYSIFPDGCRHILIDKILYITGGNNKCGYIVLSYDILSHQLTRLSNLNSEHYFHTLEYIDNFDCILCIGGENSSSCEIMDISQKKWTKLPQLNYPRANCNVYYNNINEQIYVLFGMKGNIWEKNNKNIDKIEMLELNNIEKGWIVVDYYKSCGIDLKFNFCKTIPFTKDKLIIFGGNNMRGSESLNFYVIFDMNKNEIFQVDKQTMDMIKIEEKKMRMADYSLTKFS